MKNWVTKKKMLVISLVGTIILVSLVFIQGEACYGLTWCREYVWDAINTLGVLLLPFPIVLLYSLVTYWLRGEVFEQWKEFTIWWIPLTFFLMLIMPGSSHSWAIGGSERDFITFLMLGLFIVISLILIIKKHFQLRNQKPKDL